MKDGMNAGVKAQPMMPQAVLEGIRDIARRQDLDRIILFGSRARGDHRDRSDIDLAFAARDSERYFAVQDALEELDTLLLFDLVDMNGISFSQDLAEEIKRDGVVLYEKV